MPQPAPSTKTAPDPAPHHLRLHRPFMHLDKMFGRDRFALEFEAFAHSFGTQVFLVGRTLVVRIWIAIDVLVLTKTWHFSQTLFIVLNLAFSLQAACAAPLVLLAQKRQADRHGTHARADAAHREGLAQGSIERQALVNRQAAASDRNCRLTAMAHDPGRRIDQLATEIHAALVRGSGVLRVLVGGPPGGGVQP